MRKELVHDAFGRLFVGAPARPCLAGARVVPGRAQTRWGAWWERHPRALRGFALLALAWMTTYVAWRIGWSRQGSNPVLWSMLLIVEACGLCGVAILAWFSWRIPASVRRPVTPGHKVDVYVCTYDEPEAVLRATLA